MFTVPTPARPQVVLTRSRSGLPAASLQGLGFDFSGFDDSGDGGGDGFDWAGLTKAITAAATGATTAIKATQSPYVLPGTNVLYNPQTGAVATPAGITLSQTASSSTPLLLGALALGAVLLVVAMKK